MPQKLLKALQNKEFDDLNLLLPTSLYDAVTHPNSFENSSHYSRKHYLQPEKNRMVGPFVETGVS